MSDLETLFTNYNEAKASLSTAQEAEQTALKAIYEFHKGPFAINGETVTVRHAKRKGYYFLPVTVVSV